jgi:hypothetical protein
LGLVLSAAWLFAAFSYYLSRKTGTDWFARSGSIMGLSGAAVTFRLAHFYQGALATALKEGLVSVSREIELGLKPPKSYLVLSYGGYLTGIVGTGIWTCCSDSSGETPRLSSPLPTKVLSFLSDGERRWQRTVLLVIDNGARHSRR